MARIGQSLSFDPEQHRLELDLRSRSARRARGLLQRMEPMVLLTPPWSSPRSFLEELALEMAMADPPLRCRTLSVSPLRSRERPEIWKWLLTAFAGLEGGRHLDIPYVASTVGFRQGLLGVLLQLQAHLTVPTALLIHDAEVLPAEVRLALMEAWSRFRQDLPAGRRVEMILAGRFRPENCCDLQVISLTDYGNDEASEVMESLLPCAPAHIKAAVLFSGGIPDVLGAMATHLRRAGTLSPSTTDLLQSLGGLQQELAATVRTAHQHPQFAQRLSDLGAAGELPWEEDVDEPLERAGLLARNREVSRLRAPLFDALAG
jgi:hypothetical protein